MFKLKLRKKSWLYNGEQINSPLFTSNKPENLLVIIILLRQCPSNVQASGSVLICDSINQNGIDILKKAGMKVDYKPNILTDELLSIVKDYQVILVRSRTKITREVIQAAIGKTEKES